MDFESVGQIFDMVEKTRQRLKHHVEGISEEQQSFRPGSDAWTIAEIVEHLANVQEGMGKIASKLAKEAEALAAPASAGGKIAPVSMAFIRERSAERFQAPENVRPHGTVAVADSLIRLQQNYDRLLAMRPRIEAWDLAACTFPHPAFGELSGYQWLGLLGFHETRHTNQIERIKASAGYPA